ncbi:MAG TPA: hypothetical protein VHP37_22510 [Burkholderiales bacterium]|nr:hypothetical protein [Burkholderiales bacterium]
MKGILFSQMEPPPALEAEFNDWYETEHIPVRLALAGFDRAVRYREQGVDRKYLAIYEIGDMAVLDSPGYHVVKTQPSVRTASMLKAVRGFTRYTCTEICDSSGGGTQRGHLTALTYVVEPGRESAFDAACRGGGTGLRAYKVISADGGPWTHIVLRATGGDDAPIAGFEPAARWRYDPISAHEGRAS